MTGVLIRRKTLCGCLIGHGRCRRKIAAKSCAAVEGICAGRQTVYDPDRERFIRGLPLDPSLGIMPPGTTMPVVPAMVDSTA